MGHIGGNGWWAGLFQVLKNFPVITGASPATTEMETAPYPFSFFNAATRVSLVKGLAT